MATRESHTWREILVFYLPLSLNVGVITLTMPFLNLGVSRAAEPEVALAAFGAGFSLTIMYNTFIYTSLKLYNAHLTDRESFWKILRVYLALAGAGSLLFAVVGLTAIGEHLFSSLFGIRPETAAHAKDWMLWCAPVPVLVAVRCAFQGVTTVYRNTLNTALGTLVRMGAVLMAVTALITFFPHRPGMAAGAAFSLSMGLETAFLLVRTRKMRRFSTPTAVSACDYRLTTRYILRFSMPLWVSSLAWAGSFPVINYFIGQAPEAEAGLAGFSILRSLTVLLNSPLHSLVTVVLIMGNAASITRVKGMGICIAGLMTAASAALGFPAVHGPVLAGMFNLSGQALAQAGSALGFFLVFPVFLLVRFYYDGLFMRRKDTTVIGLAGGLRAGILLVSGTLALRWFPGAGGVALGMALMTIVTVSDALFTAAAYEIRYRPGHPRPVL